MSSFRSRIPTVNEIMESPAIRGLIDRASHNTVVSGVRSYLSQWASQAQRAAADFQIPTVKEFAEQVALWIQSGQPAVVRPVINGSGILLPPELGKAPLAQEAMRAMFDAAGGYASVSLDLTSGKRTSPGAMAERLCCQQSGAEGAILFASLEGALLAAIGSLGPQPEVVVARAHLEESDDGVRLHELLAACGCTLKEVGSANSTRADDYTAAISGGKAGAILASCAFAVPGSSEHLSLEEIVRLADEKKLPVLNILRRGGLFDFTELGLQPQPRPQESLKAGADLVLMTGDDLLGGPRCGILLGKKMLIEKIRKHPLTAALRVDKATAAALSVTLKLYEEPETAKRSIPLLNLLDTSLENLKNRAERLAPQLAACESVAAAEIKGSTAYLGSDRQEKQAIPSLAISLTPAKGSASDFALRLRQGIPAVVGQLQSETFLLDLRGIFPHQDLQLAEALGCEM